MIWPHNLLKILLINVLLDIIYFLLLNIYFIIHKSLSTDVSTFDWLNEQQWYSEENGKSCTDRQQPLIRFISELPKTLKKINFSSCWSKIFRKNIVSSSATKRNSIRHGMFFFTCYCLLLIMLRPSCQWELNCHGEYHCSSQ